MKTFDIAFTAGLAMALYEEANVSEKDIAFFNQLVGAYSPSKGQGKCTTVGDLVLAQTGVFARSYCTDKSKSGSGYTFGIWGVNDGEYSEKPNNRDTDLAVNDTKILTSKDGRVRLGNTTMERRSSAKPLDRLPYYFDTFQSENCKENRIKTLIVSVMGSYSVSRCSDQGPVELEIGSFELEHLERENLTLVFKPVDGVLYSVNLTLTSKNDLLINQTPLKRLK